MPDPLFATFKSPSAKKRKRSQPSVVQPNTPRSKAGPSNTKSSGRNASDEELEDGHVGAFDDVDLEPPPPEDEDDHGVDDETPAQKRLRLAKMYLDSVKTGLGRRPRKTKGDESGSEESLGEGEVEGWDAEDIDREIIEARLQKDIVSTCHDSDAILPDMCLASSSKALGAPTFASQTR